MHIHTSKKPVYLCTVPRLSQIHVSMVNQHKVSLLTIDVRTRKESSVFDSTWCLSFNKNEDRYTPLNYILIRNELESFIGPPINSLKCLCILAKCSWSNLSCIWLILARVKNHWMSLVPIYQFLEIIIVKIVDIDIKSSREWNRKKIKNEDCNFSWYDIKWMKNNFNN